MGIIQYIIDKIVAHLKYCDYFCKTLNQTFIHTIFS